MWPSCTIICKWRASFTVRYGCPDAISLHSCLTVLWCVQLVVSVMLLWWGTTYSVHRDAVYITRCIIQCHTIVSPNPTIVSTFPTIVLPHPTIVSTYPSLCPNTRCMHVSYRKITVYWYNCCSVASDSWCTQLSH